MGCLGLSAYTIMSSANRDGFMSFFLVCKSLFTFLPYVIGKDFQRDVAKECWEGRPCRVPCLTGKASGFSPLSITLAVDLWNVEFMKLRKSPSVSSLLTFLSWMGVGFRQKKFYLLISSCNFYFFSLFVWWIALSHFSDC